MSFAEKVAKELARRNRSVLPPIYIQGGGKVDMLEFGNLDQITTHKEEYLLSFVDRLLEKIPEHLSLQFVELALPTKANFYGEHQLWENVYLRYIEMYDIRIDGKAQRWDALIRLPNDYVVVDGPKE